jgi:hypothetical protein
MKAFISWSGSRELLIAQALQQWLSAVVPEITSFVSPDLPKGQAWFAALARELRDARLGFMCLARPRVASEWQLVEAGAIWKAASSGGLFPLCFGIGGAELPEPLRAFQLTRFDETDFLRLAGAVATLAHPAPAATSVREQALAAAWPLFKQRVEDALQQPDDGIHQTRGFIHEVSGGWWERVRSERGGTQLSWMWLQADNGGNSLTITGRGFGKGGLESARWETRMVSVEAHLPSPTLSYYWEGRHPRRPDQLFGGKCTLRFTVSGKGSIEQGTGEFMDVCLSEALPPTTKLIDVVKASTPDVDIMTGKDERERRELAERTLKAWP